MLTVLIPTHGRPTLLRRTLESVAQCKRPVGYEGRLVVENGSRAGGEAIVREVASVLPRPPAPVPARGACEQDTKR